MDGFNNTFIDSSAHVSVSSSPCSIAGDGTLQTNQIGTVVFVLSASQASGPCSLIFATKSSNSTFAITMNIISFLTMSQTKYIGGSASSTKCKRMHEQST